MRRFAVCLLAVLMAPLLMGVSITETAGLKVSIEDGRLVLSEFDVASLHNRRKETGKKRFFFNSLRVAKIISRGKDEPSYILWEIDMPDDPKIIYWWPSILLPDRLVVGEVPASAIELEKPKPYRLGEKYGVNIYGGVSWSTDPTGWDLMAEFSQDFCVLQDKQGQHYVQLLEPGDECKPKRKWFGWFE